MDQHFWDGFEKQANFMTNLVRGVSTHAGNAAKNLTSKALAAKSTLGTGAYGAMADVAGRVAKHPKAALGIAGGALAGGAGGAYLAGRNKE